MLIGLHCHLIQKERPIFNFIFFDQPSQVYFPQEVKEDSIKLKNTDIVSVREIFNTLNQAVIDNKGKLQIVVLDHADATVWGSIPEEQRHIVANWSEGDALIPHYWYEDMISQEDSLTEDIQEQPEE